VSKQILKKKKMWKAGLCTIIVLILGVIAVALDILIIEKGHSADSAIVSAEATVHYGYHNLWINVESDIYESGNRTTSVTYSDAYHEQCEETEKTDTDYCENLKTLENAGKVYIAFAILGGVFCLIALLLCFIQMIGNWIKWMEHSRFRSFPLRYAVATLLFLAVISFLISWIVFWTEYATNLDDVLDGLLTTYYPAIKRLDWDDAYVGPSIDLLIVSSAMGLVALAVTIILERSKSPEVHAGYERQ
jgi:hypothetical protein